MVIDGMPKAVPAAPRVMAWADLVQDQLPPDDIAAEAALIPATALACLIYTSGTGGSPRGVMLPHRCMLANCAGAFDVVRALDLKDEIYLSYLPLAHAFEHTVGAVLPAQPRHRDLLCPRRRASRGRPADGEADLLTAVPRVLEVIRMRMLAGVAREKPLAAAAVPGGAAHRPEAGGPGAPDLRASI